MLRSEAIGARISAEADGWIGTPYRHQQRAKGIAADCAGLIIGVGLACRVMEWTPDQFRPFARYSRLPNPSRFMTAMSQFLRPHDEIETGRVLVFAWRENMPMHLGIADCAGGVPYVTHAFEHRGMCVKHILDSEWRARIHSVWRYPGHP